MSSRNLKNLGNATSTGKGSHPILGITTSHSGWTKKKKITSSTGQMEVINCGTTHMHEEISDRMSKHNVLITAKGQHKASHLERRENNYDTSEGEVIGAGRASETGAVDDGVGAGRMKSTIV
jgi:hypothetical protein